MKGLSETQQLWSVGILKFFFCGTCHNSTSHQSESCCGHRWWTRVALCHTGLHVNHQVNMAARCGYTHWCSAWPRLVLFTSIRKPSWRFLMWCVLFSVMFWRDEVFVSSFHELLAQTRGFPVNLKEDLLFIPPLLWLTPWLRISKGS